MQQSSINTRAILIYGLVGIALLVLIVFGISWAKNRSDQVASQTQNQTASNQQDQQPSGDQNQASNNGDQSQTQNQPQDNTASNPSTGGDQEVDGHVSGAATTGPHTVPAAGASDWPVFVGAISLASFAVVKFVQSRRQLQATR